MAYQAIQDHGAIGDMHTLALVGIDGCIDWLCWPRFDSPSVFASILDDRIGGSFEIQVGDDRTHTTQYYIEDTNVLVTRFSHSDCEVEVTDFMPLPQSVASCLIRLITMKQGSGRILVRCRPAFNYARDSHEIELRGNVARFESPTVALTLEATVTLSENRQGGVSGTFELSAGEQGALVLRDPTGETESGITMAKVSRLRDETIDAWRKWLSQSTYDGKWQSQVRRSALTLKLLSYQPAGSLLAAPTTSLPETIGGERNWDYRYTWIRDGALTAASFMRIGFFAEVEGFIDWVTERFAESSAAEPLQIMYGIDGRHELTEVILPHLDGHRSSKPVRIGNAAATQMQLDIYGELLDMVWLYLNSGRRIPDVLRPFLQKATDWVCANWQRKDEGIWEVRGGARHFVYSKLMCWVALDRAIRIFEGSESVPAAWGRTRQKIRDELLRRGWSHERKAFVQYYDSQALDASNLMISLVDFLPADDSRILSTLDATLKPVQQGGLMHAGHVYRYNVSHSVDGLTGHEGTFNLCTFWLVSALARAGRIRIAEQFFENMLSSANHLDLYAEETGPDSEALGNFPQAFSHLGLIEGAVALATAGSPSPSEDP